MKKTFLTALAALVLISLLAGCGKSSNKSEPYSSNSTDSAQEKVLFNGTVTYKWDDVKSDYEDIEEEAEDEIEAKKEYTREDIEKLYQNVQTGLSELTDGVTKENLASAHSVYKNAHKLEILAKRDDKNKDNKFLALAKDAKAIVRQYHGYGDENFEDLKDRIESTFDDIKDYTDDKWNEFLDMLKM